MYRRGVSKTFLINQQHAGIVIGPKGAGIKSLKEIPGVYSVNFDTRRGYNLCVQATSTEVCDLVNHEVQKRIARNTGKASRFPTVTKSFIEANRKQKMVLDTKDSGARICCVVQEKPDRPFYHFLKFDDITRCESMKKIDIQDHEKSSYDMVMFKEETLINSLKETLDIIKKEAVTAIDFNVSPGKYIFLNRVGSRHQKCIFLDASGTLRNGEFHAAGIQPVYNTFLRPELFVEIRENLKQEGFSNVNEADPEKFTTVHLFAGEEKTRFSVILALDENLNEIDESNEPRLSEEKHKAIENVYEAKTIGDVLGTEFKSVKVAFRKMSLLLHPDKNSHPGATKAFKKLQHAYEEVNAGKEAWTPAMKIIKESANTSKPPKVISVKTEKKKICNITFFSGDALDVRASISSFKEDVNKLSNHVRDVLNECWDKRDTEGGIITPDGSSGIYIQCIKQVTAAHIWLKVVETNFGEAVFEVKVKEMREKIEGNAEWQECVEIDMKILVDGRSNLDMSSEELACQISEIRKFWKLICPN